MQALDINTLNFRFGLDQVRNFVTHEAVVPEVTFWGTRTITLTEGSVRGSIDLNELLARVREAASERCRQDNLTPEQRLAGVTITQILQRFYEQTDNQLYGETDILHQIGRIFTRFLVWIREFSIGDTDRLSLEEGYISRQFRSVGEERFARLYEQAEVSLNHPACEAFLQEDTAAPLRIVLREEVIEGLLEKASTYCKYLEDVAYRNDPYIFYLRNNVAFLDNPTLFLMEEMIERGPHSARRDDHPRAALMNMIPHFIDYATSIENLRAFADKHYFRSAENKSAIMERFDRSLNNKYFLSLLEKAKKEFLEIEFGFCDAEQTLREAFLIFSQVGEGGEFHPVSIRE